MTVACDRVARPQWEAVEDREAIEAAIPDGARVTLLARTGPRDLTARLLVTCAEGHDIVVRTQRGHDAAWTVRTLLASI